MPGVFVDREHESARMIEFVQQLSHGGPRVLAVHGDPGIGKSALLGAFEQWVRSNAAPRVRRVAAVRCHGQIGTENAYGPMIDIVKALRARLSRGRVAKLGTRAAVDSGAEILANLVPAAGPALRAGVGAVGKGAAASALPEVPVPRLVADAILGEVRQGRPVVLIIDDAHLIDTSSCLVLDRLLASQDSPLGIVLGMRNGELTDQNPLREIIDRSTIQETCSVIDLSGFAPAAVDSFVRARYGTGLTADQIATIHERTGGHPIFVSQYLSMIRESENGPTWPAPSSAAAVIRQRLRGLDPTDLELLSLAAVHGERFISSVVERLSGRDRSDVLDRLYQVSTTSGLIRLREPDEWTRRAGADHYEFEHAFVREALYTRQSPQSRRERHAAVAGHLDEMMRDWSTKPQEYLLEVIKQHHLGGQSLPAASKALEMARSLIATGGSLDEAERLCRQALDDVRQAESGATVDRLRVEIIELLLLATESRWSVNADFLASTPLEELSDEAVAAAERCDELNLRVRAAALRGRVLHKVRGVDHSLRALAEAVRLAKQSEDLALLFLTSSAYGRELTKRDLHAGLAALLDAERLAEEHDEVGRSTDPALAHAVARTAMQVGVSMFDAGDLGAADERLLRCVARLRADGDAGTMPTALNYLAQVQMALGQWEQALLTLRDAVAREDAEPSAWHGYNVALLGKLHLECGESAEAGRAFEAAWQETSRTWLVNIATLVCNLYAEFEIHRVERGEVDGQWVRDLLLSNIERAETAGLWRSVVVGLSLLGRLSLARGELDEALDASERAERILHTRGPLPAVRDEEVLYWRAVVLDKAGKHTEAAAALAAARAKVERQAATLTGRQRIGFLTRVPLNAKLMAD
ncbi:AAA ATPase-like protein [Herbihabitans rhizosphaerae]|uniref:AAA ATPase-like protein n=2 Tax=Herbihabitans rhizosphaerae TaxID=1872711 RepID=A0A4Q7KWY2_9PSEU|nr:AAA ATPase-like protein [Herbihabitans rhizosphaerae]